MAKRPKRVCTFPDGASLCKQPAISAVKGEGRIFWFRCEKHEGQRANGERGEILRQWW
jgi:hypothetical protein